MKLCWCVVDGDVNRVVDIDDGILLDQGVDDDGLISDLGDFLHLDHEVVTLLELSGGLDGEALSQTYGANGTNGREGIREVHDDDDEDQKETGLS